MSDNYFDRTLCAEPCGMMHTRCLECGDPLDRCEFVERGEDFACRCAAATVSAASSGATSSRSGDTPPAPDALHAEMERLDSDGQGYWTLCECGHARGVHATSEDGRCHYAPDDAPSCVCVDWCPMISMRKVRELLATSPAPDPAEALALLGERVRMYDEDGRGIPASHADEADWTRRARALVEEQGRMGR
jgi:hypothetical protein